MRFSLSGSRARFSLLATQVAGIISVKVYVILGWELFTRPTDNLISVISTLWSAVQLAIITYMFNRELVLQSNITLDQTILLTNINDDEGRNTPTNHRNHSDWAMLSNSEQ